MNDYAHTRMSIIISTESLIRLGSFFAALELA